MTTTLISVVTVWLATMLSFGGTTLPNASNHSMHIHRADTTIDWEHMSKPERKDYMKNVIIPKMKPLMQNFDAKMFKNVNCGTCHGNGARTGEFKMPNPDLPKLPATREGFEKLNKDKPKMMEFMSKTVKPTMASLLGMKEFDMKTGQGFGCGNCHTSEKK